MEKSANKRWRESGTTLNFKDWIDRENKKKDNVDNFLPFDANQSVKDTINETLNRSKEEMKVISGYKTKPDNTKFLGLDKKVLLFSSVIVLGSVGYLLYNKFKSNER